MIVLRILLGGIWSVALIAAITFCWADLTSGTAPQKVHDVLPFHAGALEQVLRSEVEQQIASEEFAAGTVGGQLSVQAPLVEWPFIESALQANSEGHDEDAYVAKAVDNGFPLGGVQFWGFVWSACVAVDAVVLASEC